MKPWTPKTYRDYRDLCESMRRGERPRMAFTTHCGQRFTEMGVTEDEIFECVARPESITVTDTHRAVNLKAGRITLGVVVDPETGYPHVATVLWRYSDGWTKAATEGRLGKGRVLHDDMSHLPTNPEAA